MIVFLICLFLSLESDKPDLAPGMTHCETKAGHLISMGLSFLICEIIHFYLVHKDVGRTK